ncbi:ABC transporter permease [Arsenicicoccus dermatophilus]|uniref:ABC transporter permease n=1 Tax=Arsenicicoccus dermatophilus TaxID=1076331 RepID=UPI001F4C6726|nr:ABC transporter permease [Arsenicicoccus dermatophilus]MCH8612310.1 ABC transporter permease [Arsenicicoccus dermatophilus]
MSPASTALADAPLVAPGRSNGLLDIPRWRFLLSLLVRKEMRVRYRGSVLGLLWSYVKPAVQIFVFWLALGKFLRLEAAIHNYVIYMFSGVVMVNFFNEIFGNTTRSIVRNADLVKKIYLPRELFPVASVWVAFIHFVPQLVVLLVGALFVGWRPGPLHLLAAAGSILITGLLALGLGLLFGAVNVLFRDAENFVDLIVMMATWLSPVLYTWQKVHDALPAWLWALYQVNPLTAAVELIHYAFWIPTRGVTADMPPSWPWWSLLGLALSGLVVGLGQMVFRRLEGRFAQEL